MQLKDENLFAYESYRTTVDTTRADRDTATAIGTYEKDGDKREAKEGAEISEKGVYFMLSEILK